MTTQWRIQIRRLRSSVELGGAKKVFTCLNTKVCLRQPLGVTQKWLPFADQEVTIFVGRTMRYFEEKPQFESTLYHCSRQVLPTITKNIEQQNNPQRKSKVHNNRRTESNIRRLKQLLNKPEISQLRSVR